MTSLVFLYLRPTTYFTHCETASLSSPAAKNKTDMTHLVRDSDSGLWNLRNSICYCQATSCLPPISPATLGAKTTVWPQTRSGKCDFHLRGDLINQSSSVCLTCRTTKTEHFRLFDKRQNILFYMLKLVFLYSSKTFFIRHKKHQTLSSLVPTVDHLPSSPASPRPPLLLLDQSCLCSPSNTVRPWTFSGVFCHVASSLTSNISLFSALVQTFLFFSHYSPYVTVMAPTLTTAFTHYSLTQPWHFIQFKNISKLFYHKQVNDFFFLTDTKCYITDVCLLIWNFCILFQE